MTGVQAQQCVPTQESLEPTGWQGQVAGKQKYLVSQSFLSTHALTF